MTSRIETIPIAQIRPREDQPRQHFSETGIDQLADSIRAQGFIGQVTVRRVNGHYELLAGHRRRLAASVEEDLGTDRGIPCSRRRGGRRQ